MCRRVMLANMQDMLARSAQLGKNGDIIESDHPEDVVVLDPSKLSFVTVVWQSNLSAQDMADLTIALFYKYIICSVSLGWVWRHRHLAALAAFFAILVDQVWQWH